MTRSRKVDTSSWNRSPASRGPTEADRPAAPPDPPAALTAVAEATADAAEDAVLLLDDAVDEDAVAQIVAMGFSRKSAVAALERSSGDVQRAIDGLLASS